MHLDDNQLNNNLSNLQLGTHADNVADKMAKGRYLSGQRKKIHCPKGHPYDEENTYWTKAGSRQCRSCNSARSAVYNERMKAMRAEGRAGVS